MSTRKSKLMLILFLLLMPYAAMAVDAPSAVADIFQADVEKAQSQSIEGDNDIYLSVLLALFILSLFTVSCSARCYLKKEIQIKNTLSEYQSKLDKMIPEKVIVHTEELAMKLNECEKLTSGICDIEDKLLLRREA